MNNNINLVSGDLGNTSKEARRLRRLKTIATSLIMGIGFLSILLFALNYFFSPQSVISQQEAVLAQISSAQAKHTKITVLNQRLNDISNLLSRRTGYDLVLESILNESPNDISIVSLSIDKKKLSMVVSSGSLLSMSEFIDVLRGMVERRIFLENVIINNLALNSRGANYLLTLEVSLL